MANNIPEGGTSYSISHQQSTQASMISLLIGDGQTFQSFTFPLILELQTKDPSFPVIKPFLVANNDSFEGLRLDMMQFFSLSCAPDLWVNWAPGSGMENVLIGDHNMKTVLRLLRARGSVDKLYVEPHE
jgi:hypothetical protein